MFTYSLYRASMKLASYGPASAAMLARTALRLATISVRRKPYMHADSFSCAARLFNGSKHPPPVHAEADNGAPTIPPYEDKFTESVKERRARLLYQSRKRGMLENGLLLGTFADKHLNGFTEEQLILYDRLINLPSNDWEIFYWATGIRPTPEEFDNEIMDLLKIHTKNKNRESRITMPPLKEKQ